MDRLAQSSPVTATDIEQMRQANARLLGRRPAPEVRRLPSGLIIVRGAPPIVDRLLRDACVPPSR